MDVTFTEEQDALRAAVADLLADRSDLGQVRAVAEGEVGSDLELYRMLAEMGATDLPGLVELGVVIEECGRALAPIPLVPAVGVALPAARAADPDHWLVDAARRGEAIPVLGSSGAVRVDGGYAEGELTLVPDAHVATHALFIAGGSLYEVALEECAVSPLVTMDTTRRLSHVTLDGAPVGEVGAAAAADATDAASLSGCVALAHELVGVAQACLDLAVAHAKAREQFGKPIGTYQAISHRCADMFVAVEAARSLAYHAAWAVQTGATEAPLAASQAKACAGEAAVGCAQSAIQVHGGIGFTWEHDLHLYLKRARAGAAMLGTPTEHRRRVADLIGL
jgi:alkylation response protein AidB-like acyl-CoA dehydrogenase